MVRPIFLIFVTVIKQKEIGPTYDIAVLPELEREILALRKNATVVMFDSLVLVAANCNLNNNLGE